MGLVLGLRSLRIDEKQSKLVASPLYHLRGGENREMCPVIEVCDCIDIYVSKK